MQRTILAAVAALLAVPSGPARAQAGVPDSLEFDGAYVSLWTREMAQRIAPGPATTLPLVLPSDPVIAPDLWVWDAWPLRTLDGQVAEVEGWVVLFALVASRDLVPGQRHGAAEWGFFYRREGEPWRYGGRVFPEGASLGEREWAGSSYIDPATGELTLYYTALGELPPAGEEATDGARFRSRSVLARVTARLVADADGVRLEGFSEHERILSADGTIYQTAEQAEEAEGPYIFRDPWYWRAPDGAEYLLFAATTAFEVNRWNGAIGLARRTADGRWALLPPILMSPEVNSQLERPHVVAKDGRLYLFFTSHGFSFAEGLSGPDGLYGFVTDSSDVRGRYRPLNGSGLVLGNPPSAPLQLYSFVVLPDEQVLSFVNYFDLGDVTLEQIGDQSDEFQKEHFGGTPAPLLGIAVEGDRTALRGTRVARPAAADPGAGALRR